LKQSEYDDIKSAELDSLDNNPLEDSEMIDYQKLQKYIVDTHPRNNGY